jgi:hypothetical protein
MAMTATMISPAPRAADILPAYANIIPPVDRLHRRLMDVATESRIDRRTVRISLGERGNEIHAIIVRAYAKHATTVDRLDGIYVGDLDVVNRSQSRSAYHGA